MKLLMVGSLLFSGAGAVAMQDQDVNTSVSNFYNRAKVAVAHQFRQNQFDRIREEGFPYPPQAYLDTLTDEQEAVIMTAIDQINAEYDFSTMTDDQIIEVLQTERENLLSVYEDLGLEAPQIRSIIRNRIQQKAQELTIDYVRENGITYPKSIDNANFPEDMKVAIVNLIDSYNSQYDFSTMSDDEIAAVLVQFHDEMVSLRQDFGFDHAQNFSFENGRHQRGQRGQRGQNRSFSPNDDTITDQTTDDTQTDYNGA